MKLTGEKFVPAKGIAWEDLGGGWKIGELLSPVCGGFLDGSGVSNFGDRE